MVCCKVTVDYECSHVVWYAVRNDETLAPKNEKKTPAVVNKQELL